MAVTLTPTTIFTDIAVDGTNLTIPLASIPELEATEVTGEGADLRKLIYALVAQMEEAFNDIEVASRPTRLTITKSADINVGGSDVVRNYTFSFRLAATAQDVADEPVEA